MSKKINVTKLLMSVLFLALVVSFVSVTGAVNANAAARMKKADFLKTVVSQIKGKKNVDGKKISVTISSKGSVTVMGKTYSKTTVADFKKKYGGTTKQAQYVVAAAKLGLIDENTFKGAGKYITYGEAMAIMERAYELLNKDKITADEVEFVKGNRLSGITDVSDAEQALVIKAYMRGFYAGKSDGSFTKTRTIKYSSNAAKTELSAMAKRLTSSKDRYKFSEDWQMLRISTKNMPKQAKYFPYILDDFTNEYYDTEFEFMQKTSMIYANTELSKDFGGGTISIQRATWDNAFKYASFENRSKWIIGYLKAAEDGDMIKYASATEDFWMKLFSQYILPSEMSKFTSVMKKNEKDIPTQGYTLQDGDAKKIAERAEAYTRTVFNVNYKTIENLAQIGCNVDFSDAYIRDCVLNETIIECDKVAADPGSISYQVNYNGNRMDGYSIRVYVHYRIVNDNGRGSNAIVYNSQIPGDEYPTSLREVKASKDGLTFEWAGNDGKWRDGYFDVFFRTGYTGFTTEYDLTRSRNNYTELLGGPKQCAYGGPGRLTAEGVFISDNMIGVGEWTQVMIDKTRNWWNKAYGKYVPRSY